MITNSINQFVEQLLIKLPEEWLALTTHRLDVYKEDKAKTEFLTQLEALFTENNLSKSALANLPTAYDYIRLGHPLSSVLEWTLAKKSNLPASHVISFSSQTAPVLAILRSNLMLKKDTILYYKGDLPASFNQKLLQEVYNYQFQLVAITNVNEIIKSDETTILVHNNLNLQEGDKSENVDFYIDVDKNLGSILTATQNVSKDYIDEIQHVRRRETIAMTPNDCHIVLQQLVGKPVKSIIPDNYQANKLKVNKLIKEITDTSSEPLIGSSGLSMQYAIMMGLINHAQIKHPNKDINIILPPNCYGGTNDQARRVAACISRVSVLDLPVDGENDMVQSAEKVLDTVAKNDAVPLIITEIPTNPRVEVPNLNALRETLLKERKTNKDSNAVAPVFILDQTFCPNYKFLSQGGVFDGIATISYVSGSKFPSGGKCTAGYCAANKEAEGLLDIISEHLVLCDNEATPLQMEKLAEQLPSMNQRIADAYENTRSLVNYIEKVLPSAKINFVTEELATAGFKPSVFSLDLPTKGDTPEEKESHKRELNHILINMMITRIPNESKYCVSYGQLKGCYWTIPATSTQGTTKETDKDYIARVAVSPELNLDLHKEVFKEFVAKHLR